MAEQHHTTDTSDQEIDLRGVLYSGVGLVLLVVVSIFAMRGLLDFLTDRHEQANRSQFPLAAKEYSGELADRFPPEPRLEGLDLRDKTRSGVQGWPSFGPELQRQQQKELDSYGWVNEDEDLVHIPIEEAMRQLVGKLPARDVPPPDFDSANLPTDASAGRQLPGGSR